MLVLLGWCSIMPKESGWSLTLFICPVEVLGAYTLEKGSSFYPQATANADPFIFYRYPRPRFYIKDFKYFRI